MVRRSLEPPRMMTARDVAEYLAVSVNTVRRMAERGDIPKPVRFLAKIVRWDRRAIEACLDRNRDGYVDPDELFERWAEERRAPGRLVIRFESRRLLTYWPNRHGDMCTAPDAVVTNALTQLGIGDLGRLVQWVLDQPAPEGGKISEMKTDADVDLTMRDGKITLDAREPSRNLVRRRVPG